MHILVQEINKRASFLPFLCDILLKSLHFVKRRNWWAEESLSKEKFRRDVGKKNFAGWIISVPNLGTYVSKLGTGVSKLGTYVPKLET